MFRLTCLRFIASLLIFLTAGIALTSCRSNDDDDSSAGAADDDIDDDAIDDDAVDDDVDDDTVDDDAIDDDAIDDDLTDDDAAAGPDHVCENPFDQNADPCSQAMKKIYCWWRLPVIFELHWYSQHEAVEACQAASSPVWSDIVSCVDEGDFAGCLQDRGWPPELPEIFDVDEWEAQGEENSTKNQALNFFYYDYDHGADSYVEYSGGIVFPSQPLLRLNVESHDSTMIFDMTTWDTGVNTSYSADQIDFWVWGLTRVFFETAFWLPDWRTVTFQRVSQGANY